MRALFEQLILLHEGMADAVGLISELDELPVPYDSVDRSRGYLVDLYNREIVGHSAGPGKDARLVKSAFATLPFPIVNVNVFLPNRANYFCPIAPAHDVQPHQCKLPNSGYSSFIFLSVGTSLSL